MGLTQGHEISLKTSRKTWMDPAEEKYLLHLGIGNFCLQEDRIALCAYGLTGELLPQTAAVGSVVMFAPLPASGSFLERPKDENFLHTIPLEVCAAPHYVACGLFK